MNPADKEQKRKLTSASILATVLAVVSLGLVGFGCWLAYEPAGFIIPGLLIWIDISRK